MTGIYLTTLITMHDGESEFSVTQSEVLEDYVKVEYREPEATRDGEPVEFMLPSLSKEEFQTLVASVNGIMGWNE